MIKRITCCHNCTRRHSQCHSDCQEYKSQRYQLDEFNTLFRKKSNEYSLLPIKNLKFKG